MGQEVKTGELGKESRRTLLSNPHQRVSRPDRGFPRRCGDPLP